MTLGLIGYRLILQPVLNQVYIFTNNSLNKMKEPITKQFIGNIALVVDDYDDAIEFYTGKLNFRLVEDTVLSETKRWVLVEPRGSVGNCRLLLAKAASEEQRSRVGNQTGGRVFLFLFTDDFWRDYDAMLAKGVEFVRPPSREEYGMVAVFKDLYGNLWDLIQSSENKT
jgi:catechol 2,3-dioxygenase-like lactoylglutathione lyase family enzyme